MLLWLALAVLVAILPGCTKLDGRDNHPPQISLHGHSLVAPGDTLDVYAQASDDRGIAWIRIAISGGFVASASKSFEAPFPTYLSYSFRVPVPPLAEMDSSLYAEGAIVDDGGNETSSPRARVGVIADQVAPEIAVTFQGDSTAVPGRELAFSVRASDRMRVAAVGFTMFGVGDSVANQAFGRTVEAAFAVQVPRSADQSRSPLYVWAKDWKGNRTDLELSIPTEYRIAWSGMKVLSRPGGAWSMVVDDRRQRLYVFNGRGNSLDVYDIPSASLIASVTGWCSAGAISQDGDSLFATAGGTWIEVYSLDGPVPTLARRIEVFPGNQGHCDRPDRVVQLPDGRLFMTLNGLSGCPMVTLNLASGRVAYVPGNGPVDGDFCTPVHVAASRDGSLILVGGTECGARVGVFDAAQDRLTAQAALGAGTFGVGMSRDGTLLLIDGRFYDRNLNPTSEAILTPDGYRTTGPWRFGESNREVFFLDYDRLGIYDTESKIGEEMIKVPGVRSYDDVRDLAVTADGRRLFILSSVSYPEVYELRMVDVRAARGTVGRE